jgi:hypothetical protein
VRSIRSKYGSRFRLAPAGLSWWNRTYRWPIATSLSPDQSVAGAQCDERQEGGCHRGHQAAAGTPFAAAVDASSRPLTARRARAGR